MAKKISGVGPIEGPAENPYEKWQAQEDLYVLSDETRRLLGVPGLFGLMRNLSGVEVRVVHYSMAAIKSDPALKKKIGQLVGIGAVGRGALDEMGQLHLQFRQDVAKKLPTGGKVQVAEQGDTKPPFSATADAEGLPAGDIAAFIEGLLAELGGGEEVVEKEGAKAVPVERKELREAVQARPTATGRPMPAKTPPRSASQRERALMAEERAAKQLRQAEHHRREREKEKKAKRQERKEQFIKDDTLKAERKQAERKQADIKKGKIDQGQ